MFQCLHRFSPALRPCIPMPGTALSGMASLAQCPSALSVPTLHSLASHCLVKRPARRLLRTNALHCVSL